jgi:hypothetical protein
MDRVKRIFVVAVVVGIAGCGGNSKHPVMGSGGTDMATPTLPSCVMNPTSATDILNACTTAQTGDPAKDYPYFPSLAPGGKLPPLP